MPRNSNPTQYDAMMSKWKQNETHTHTNAPASAARGRHAQAPRSHTPRPAPLPVAVPNPYYPVQQYAGQTGGGIAAPQNWGEQLQGSSSTVYPGVSAQDTSYTDPAYGTIPSHGPSGATLPSPTTHSPTSKWVVQFSGGQGQRQINIPIVRFDVPKLDCLCGTHIRIVHLPTIVNWNPPFGVLWNFRKGPHNGWLEGSKPNTCVSESQCPVCKTQISLYGPT